MCHSCIPLIVNTSNDWLNIAFIMEILAIKYKCYSTMMNLHWKYVLCNANIAEILTLQWKYWQRAIEIFLTILGQYWQNEDILILGQYYFMPMLYKIDRDTANTNNIDPILFWLLAIFNIKFISRAMLLRIR